MSAADDNAKQPVRAILSNESLASPDMRSDSVLGSTRASQLHEQPDSESNSLPNTQTNAPTAIAQDQAESGTASEPWTLRLYVAGQTPKSLAAFANLKAMCEEHLSGRYQIEVIDLLDKPQLAQGDQILAIPTVVRRLPLPMRKIIGDLSDTERAIVGLDLRQTSWSTGI